jgi:hypothetical protein
MSDDTYDWKGPLNVPLLRKTMEHIEELPHRNWLPSAEIRHTDSWCQETWGRVFRNRKKEICGTSACFAGWAIELDEPGALDEVIRLMDNIARTPLRTPTPAYVAARILGLTRQQAADLFAGGNSKELLRTYVDRYIADAERRNAST